MRESYARDLDLNLLRVFVAVADTGSVTKAAARLYLTQPAVSAALRRLATAIGAPVLVRHGRGVALSSRGEQLLAVVRPHLQALLDAVTAAPAFDPATSERTLRLGLSDVAEAWLLPRLLHVLAREAPRMRIAALPVTFRTVEEALLARRAELAITVADELPPAIQREPLYSGTFVALYDPRHGRGSYFTREHVVVSYAGDLRGVVEDMVGKTRRVRCALSSFSHVGDVIDGTPLVATVPRRIADHIRATRPHLAIAKLPFDLRAGTVDLLWPAALADDPVIAYVRAQLHAITKRADTAAAPSRARPRRASR